jgi:NAD+ synthase (glutamine-hydrolysing)
MRNFGFIKVGAAVPFVRVADVEYNVCRIKTLVDKAVNEGVELLCFPELSLTGYSCQDLFRNTHLLDEAEAALNDLRDYCRDLPLVVVVGAPVCRDNCLYNSAAIIAGSSCHFVNKTYLPNYNEFYEKRWFTPEESERPSKVFELPCGVKFGVEICEDLWSPLPPSSYISASGADIILNLSASDELIGKHQYLLSLISQQSARGISGYVYCSAGFGESTQDVVYGGNAIVYENGSQLVHSKRFSLEEQLMTAQIDVERLRAERLTNSTFQEVQSHCSGKTEIIKLDVAESTKPFVLSRNFNPHPFIPVATDMKASCEEIFNIQVMGLAKRLRHTNCKNVVLGISGGLDSTLALLVCIKTFDKLGLDRHGIHCVTMPGFGTTDRTHDNAVALMGSLGVTQREISIAPAVEQHFLDLGHDRTVHDVTYENSQARYRTMLLMDISNQVGGLVIGTGDLSELALGWCTYNGDHMSMYGVNVSIPKTLVRHLVAYMADNGVDAESRKTLLDIIDTPISPELIPADTEGNIKQKTEDLVGPYELHDFFLYYFLRFGFSPSKIRILAEKAFDGHNGISYNTQTIDKWLRVFIRRFFSNQFKRSCLPDGPKVGSVSLSPRGDWRMASDAVAKLWIDDIEKKP